MSKFHFKLDENGNVANISFPKTNIEATIEYPEPTEEGEVVTPSGVSIGGQSMTVDQFSEIKVEKDENGQINIGGGSSGGGNHPWWWDWWNKYHGTSEPEKNKNETIIVEEDLQKKSPTAVDTDMKQDIYTTTNVSKGVTIK